MASSFLQNLTTFFISLLVGVELMHEHLVLPYLGCENIDDLVYLSYTKGYVGIVHGEIIEILVEINESEC